MAWSHDYHAILQCESQHYTRAKGSKAKKVIIGQTVNKILGAHRMSKTTTSLPENLPKVEEVISYHLFC